MKACKLISYRKGKNFRLQPFAVCDVAGHCLKGDNTIIFYNQLGILPKPDLMSIFCDNRIFEIGIGDHLYKLTTEEFQGLFTHLRTYQYRIMCSNKLFFFVSRITEPRRIYKDEVSAIVRPEDDITRI